MRAPAPDAGARGRHARRRRRRHRRRDARPGTNAAARAPGQIAEIERAADATSRRSAQALARSAGHLPAQRRAVLTRDRERPRPPAATAADRARGRPRRRSRRPTARPARRSTRLSAAREARPAREARLEAAARAPRRDRRAIARRLETTPDGLPEHRPGLQPGAAAARAARDRAPAGRPAAASASGSAPSICAPRRNSTEVETAARRPAAERDDLTEAIRRLRRRIGSLNREGRERLLAAFEIVNGHFERLFTTPVRRRHGASSSWSNRTIRSRPASRSSPARPARSRRR